MSYAGFDLPRVRKLAGDLRKVSGSSTKLHNDLKKVLQDAEDNLAGKPATTAPSLQLVNASILGMNLSPPGTLAGSLDAMAGSIDRRATHLEKCSALMDACKGTVDPALAFADEPPPDPKKVDEALEALREMRTKDTGANGNRDDLKEVMSKLKGLTGAELDLFLDQASDEDLASLRDKMADTDDSGWTPFDHNGIPLGERVEFASALMAKVGPENMDKFQTAFPWLKPGFESTDLYLKGVNPQTGQSATGLHYGVPTDPLFTGKDLGDDIYQGKLGDCWFIASLTATAQTDPDFIREGIKENANGTISVRVWDKDGNQRWVTMDKELPLDSSGKPVTAHGDGSTWPAYYEKAFAIVYDEDNGGAPDGKEDDPRFDKAEQGNYGAIEWDYTDKAPPYVTGKDSEGIDNDEVADSFKSGHPVIVASNSDKDGVPDNWSKEQKDAYVTRHVYYVKDVTPDGKIVLGNPWGDNYPPVTVTQDEFDDMFDDAQQLEVAK